MKHGKEIKTGEIKMQTINIQKLASSDYRSHEAYNTLRTNIQFCGKDIKTICITSCTPNEGKSLVSFRLATSMAESGKKVLFIDADLRKSVLINRLKINQSVVGLSNYLSGMNSLEEVLYQSNIENLDIIFTGPIPPNPADLLGGSVFADLLKEQREQYDYIFIDTPPLGLVIDSANVSVYCDGALLVIQANAISYKFAQRVIKQLEKGNCRVLGAILNKVNLKQHGYYGRYYGRYYGKQYSNTDNIFLTDENGDEKNTKVQYLRVKYTWKQFRYWIHHIMTFWWMLFSLRFTNW